jgi:6-phospho-3-hexuloisomerase
MSIEIFTKRIRAEIKRCLEHLDGGECGRLADRILEARRVFLAGAGRSGLAVRALAMRLMHLGLTAHVVGEVTTPAIGAGDLLLVSSRSGETSSLAAVVRLARSHGAEVALVTASPGSSLAAQSDLLLRIPAAESSQPLGTLFEQVSFLLFDALVLWLLERTGADEGRMASRHANLE